MDILFNCPNCRQQLEADAAMSGQSINCPSCNVNIIIPQADPANLKTHNPAATPAGHKEHKTFSVPVHDKPAEVLIKKPSTPLEVAAAKGDGERKIRIRTIKRTECQEVGHDAFDERVTEFLQAVGETNVISTHPVLYSHIDMGSRQLLNDYGIMILYRG